MIWYVLLLANIYCAVFIGYHIHCGGEMVLLGIMLVGWKTARGEKS